MKATFVTALVVALTLSLSLVDRAWTKNISGTPRSDVLTGTRAGDVINGKGGNDIIRGLGGNDRLIGGSGNDRITGGAGADQISCGAGDDVVFADAKDRVAPDCETVKGLAPPPPLVKPGHYAALGDFLTFDVSADGKSVQNFFVRAKTPCQPPTLFLFLPLTVSEAIPIKPDRSFATTSAIAKPPGTTLAVSGSFDNAGNAVGTVTIHASLDIGTHYECNGTLPWTAALQG